MVRLLAAAAIAWPMLLATVVWHRAAHGDTVWTALTYVAASRICHQRPERSFASAGVQWPVCGRCSGLYLGAAVGALPVLILRRQPRSSRLGDRRLLALAAAPTAITLALEWTRVIGVGNLARFVTALPLGAAVLLAIVFAVAPRTAPR